MTTTQQAKIGQLVSLRIGPESFFTGRVRTRFFDASRNVLLRVEDDRGFSAVGYEYLARPVLAPVAVEAPNPAPKPVPGPDAPVAPVVVETPAPDSLYAAARPVSPAPAPKPTVDRSILRAVKAAEKEAAKERKAQEKRAEDDRKAAEREQKAAEKRAEDDRKAAEKEEQELRERALEAEAVERASRREIVDPQRGWTRRVVAGETKGRRTATRMVVGTAILPGLGTVIGGMAKKHKGYVYVQTLDAEGTMLGSSRHPADNTAWLNMQAVSFNKRHRVGTDGKTRVEHELYAKELRRQRKAVAKEHSA